MIHFYFLTHKNITLPLNLYNEFGLSDSKENMMVLQTLLFIEKKIVFTRTTSCNG